MIRIFRHYIPLQLALLAAAELLILFLSAYLGVAIRFGGSTHIEWVGPILPRAIVFALVMMGTMTALGMFTRQSQTGDLEYYMRFLASFAIGGVILLLVFYALPGVYLPRGALVLAFSLAFVGSALTRMLFMQLADISSLKSRLLVLGVGTRAARVGSLIEEDLAVSTKYNLVGFLMPSGCDHVQPHVPRDRILKGYPSLMAAVMHHDIDEIVVAIRDRRNSGLSMNELLECKLEGVQITDISSFFERETGHVQLDSLNPSWMVYSDGFQLTSRRNAAKRVFDIGVSLILLILTLPVTLLTALLIFLGSGSPIFYRQERVGECGQVFEVLKFRSMRKDAEKEGTPQWAKKNDDRVTRIGKVIRSLRIDELPQIINVLRGDMSFVGPRPERPYFVKQLAAEIPHFLTRHTVKPGITGWAQIRYPYGSSVEDALQKLQYDLYYVKNHSLFLDLIILLQTVQVVLFGKGAR